MKKNSSCTEVNWHSAVDLAHMPYYSLGSVAHANKTNDLL